MQIKKLFSLGLAVLALGTCSQVYSQIVENPDWKELDVPPPPSFNKDKLIPIEMPADRKSVV